MPSSGLNTVIAVNGNNVTFTTNISFYGPLATPANVRRIRDDIGIVWNGEASTFGGRTGINLQFVVNARIVSDQQLAAWAVLAATGGGAPADDIIRLAPIARSNVHRAPGDDRMREPLSYWVGRGGTWYRDSIVTAAHEYGHLIGLIDRYDDVNGRSVPRPGYGDSIMGTLSGTPGPTDFVNLLRGVNVHEPDTLKHAPFYQRLRGTIF